MLFTETAADQIKAVRFNYTFCDEHAAAFKATRLKPRLPKEEVERLKEAKRTAEREMNGRAIAEIDAQLLPQLDGWYLYNIDRMDAMPIPVHASQVPV